MKDKLLGMAEAFQNNKYVRAISGSMIGLMALMMISSVATLIGAIDIAGIGQMMVDTGIKAMLDQITNMSLDVISIYVAFMVAYKLGEIFECDQLNCGLMGLMSFLILTPLVAEGKDLSLSSIGSAGMFVAIIAGLVGARIYIYFIQKKIIIKMPDTVPPVVSKAFAGIIPGCMVALFMGIVFTVMKLTPFGDLSSFCYTILQTPLKAMGANIFACMFIVAFIELLWFFGIHGVMVVMPVLMLVFMEPQVANLSAYNAGEPLPYLFTFGFLLGNRGARSLAVSLLCMFNSKSVQLKSVGKVGFIPALFGISEPIKFGIPQVMNIRMLFPLMLTPAVCVFIAWFLTVIGFMPYHNGVQLPTGFPVIINGFFTNGWQGVVAQFLMLVACTIIYIPFIKSQDKVYLKEEEERAEELRKQEAEAALQE